jgi:hypothetical protein
VEAAMGRIGRTYPSHDFAQPVLVPVASGRLLFVRKRAARRFAGFFWLPALVCLLLLGWPSA